MSPYWPPYPPLPHNPPYVHDLPALVYQLQNDVIVVKTTADNAKQSAEIAQASADKAQTLAGAAQTTANSALELARRAQVFADEAAQQVVLAKKYANDSEFWANKSKCSGYKAVDAADTAIQQAKKAEEMATASADSADQSAQSACAAKCSENNAKSSELAAKASQTTAKTSETNAKASENAAKTSETNAKTSEINAKNSELAAKGSQDSANTDRIAVGVDRAYVDELINHAEQVVKDVATDMLTPQVVSGAVQQAVTETTPVIIEVVTDKVITSITDIPDQLEQLEVSVTHDSLLQTDTLWRHTFKLIELDEKFSKRMDYHEINTGYQITALVNADMIQANRLAELTIHQLENFERFSNLALASIKNTKDIYELKELFTDILFSNVVNGLRLCVQSLQNIVKQAQYYVNSLADTDKIITERLGSILSNNDDFKQIVKDAVDNVLTEDLHLDEVFNHALNG